MLLVSLGGKCGKIKAKYTLIHLGNLIVHHAELAISVLASEMMGIIHSSV